jgi:hypothetical protein
VRRVDDPRFQPVVWVVMAGAFVLVLVSADSVGEALVQGVVFAALVAVYVLVVLRRGGR